MYQIHNTCFRLSISELGAELEELCVKDINILWKRNDLWNNQSPLLFPFIGNLKEGYYLYQGKKYKMDAHGFLRNQVFQLVQKTESSITLSASYTEETLKEYPFQFQFFITYSLHLDHISISFEIKNVGTDPMYFTVGFHPGFDYDGLKQLLGENINLKFFTPKTTSILFDPKYVCDEQEIFLQPEISLTDFSKELISQRTLCYKVNQVDIKANTKAIRILHDMPFTAFWQSKPENPQFLCVEPWYGLPDENQTNHQLIEKKYIQMNSAKNTFKTKMNIYFIEGEENGNHKM